MDAKRVCITLLCLGFSITGCKNGKIVVRSERKPAKKTVTTIHEAAHYLCPDGHGYWYQASPLDAIRRGCGRGLRP